MHFSGDWPVLDSSTGRIPAKIVLTLPVLGRPNRPRDEATTAVWADIAKNLCDTSGAERALESTDSCFERAWQESLVAVFAGWAKFHHSWPPVEIHELYLEPNELRDGWIASVFRVIRNLHERTATRIALLTPNEWKGLPRPE